VPNNLQRAFGARILELRNKAGWSQEQLSEKTGISTQHISNMENGHREPCLNNMARLAKAFGVKMGELLKKLD
jgi:transcriptional regulator with XRE-family HTH domain